MVAGTRDFQGVELLWTLALARKLTHNRETKNQKIPGSGTAHREGGETQSRWRDHNPQVMICIWLKSKGGKGGANRCRKQKQRLACCAGCINKQRRMEGDGCGRCPGGRRSAPGEEVGSACAREVLWRRTVTDGEGGGMEEGIKKDPETVEICGAGGARIKLLSMATEPSNVEITVRGWNTTTS